MQGISPNEVINWINEIGNIPTGACACPDFLKPLHLVTIGLAVKKSGWTGLKLPSQLERYATRMNLWDSIGMHPPQQVTQYQQTGKFLPVQRFDQNKRDVQIVSADLAAIINQTITKEYQDSLSDCLVELVNNFFDHAKSSSELPCLVAAQTWPQGKRVQIAIADAGIGIRNSLSENSELLTPLKNGNACELASTYGVSSKLGNDHSGYGLTLARDLMNQAKGSYILISGNEVYTSKQGHDATQKIRSPWAGTVLVLEWSLDTPLSSRSVYAAWPLPEGFNQDDYF